MMRARAERTDPWSLALDSRRMFVRMSSLLTFISGVLLLWQPIFRHSHLADLRLERFLLPDRTASQQVADFASIFVGLILIYLAYELLQRKRSAWYVTLGAAIINLLAQIALDVPTYRSFFLIIVIATLLIGRRQFIVKTRPAGWSASLRALAGSVVVALAYGTIGFWLLDRRDFGVTFSLDQAFVHTLEQYSLIGTGDYVSYTHYGTWFLDSLSIVGIMTLLYCLYSILRPLRYELRTLPAERARARRLLETYGGDIDDYFKLWPEDKSYFFASDGKAFIAYAVARGVAVCFANPEGKPESIERVLAEFKDYCLNNGWLVAFIAAGDQYAAAFKDCGFKRLLIGADAVIGIDKFLGETARNKYFRNVINRFEKGKFTTTRHLPPYSAEFISELQAVSDDWLQLPNHKQWSFLTGHFSSRYFRETPLFVLRDEQGTALAFVNELPSFKADEATIDLMRHRRAVPKNSMDFLFVALMRQLQQDGAKRFNLGLSPLAREKFAGSRSERLLDYIYLATQRFVSSKGLHQYKSKFDPEWEPRYVYYIGDTSTLPQIGLALAKLTVHK